MQWMETLAQYELNLSAAALLAAGLVCLARICDVALGTIRTIYTMRGRKFVAAGIGFVEVTIFIFAISSVLGAGVRDPAKIMGYIVGYTIGIYVGISIEGWIASGWTMLRIVTREGAHVLVERLRKDGEAVTQLMGEGRDGPVPILFVVLRRKRARQVLALVREVAPRAFVTVESVGQAIGGTIAVATGGLNTPLRYLVRK